MSDPEGLETRNGKSKKKTVTSNMMRLRSNYDDEWGKFASHAPVVFHIGHRPLPVVWAAEGGLSEPRLFYEDRTELEPESERRAADERRAHDHARGHRFHGR